MEQMIGLTVLDINGLEENSEEVVIKFNCGSKAVFYHQQDCCESVWLNDFEFSGLSWVGAKVLSAEIATNESVSDYNSTTWTFYKINTDKGELFMRWCGESNGYYSESVDFEFTQGKTK